MTHEQTLHRAIEYIEQVRIDLAKDGSSVRKVMRAGDVIEELRAMLEGEADKAILRDQFAGQALAGILAAGAGEDDDQALRQIIACDAFGYADAMLAEREKRNG